MSTLFPIFELRFLPFLAAVVLTVAFAVAVAIQPHFAWLWIGFGVFGFFLLVGVHDIVQKRHAILRNYPIAAHLRFIFEEIRPELRQYFFEGDKDGMPFSRDRRAANPDAASARGAARRDHRGPQRQRGPPLDHRRRGWRSREGPHDHDRVQRRARSAGGQGRGGDRVLERRGDHAPA